MVDTSISYIGLKGINAHGVHMCFPMQLRVDISIYFSGPGEMDAHGMYITSKTTGLPW